MSLLWDFYWQVAAAGLVIGVIAGLIAFRRKERRYLFLGVGALLTIAAALAWHGPLGAADRLSGKVERDARLALNALEMTQIQAQLHHGPLSRRLVMKGQADDFQTTELARLLSQLPGVSQAQWNDATGIPLFVEGTVIALIGFLSGLLLAYLYELHRRHNAQWNW